jgi:hypothetical protein
MLGAAASAKFWCVLVHAAVAPAAGISFVDNAKPTPRTEILGIARLGYGAAS